MGYSQYYNVDNKGRLIVIGRSADFYDYIKKNPGTKLRDILRKFDMHDRNARRILRKMVDNNLLTKFNKIGDSADYYNISDEKVVLVVSKAINNKFKNKATRYTK